MRQKLSFSLFCPVSLIFARNFASRGKANWWSARNMLALNQLKNNKNRLYFWFLTRIRPDTEWNMASVDHYFFIIYSLCPFLYRPAFLPSLQKLSHHLRLIPKKSYFCICYPTTTHSQKGFLTPIFHD